MHYFQWNIKSYVSATVHLTNEEDLAYRRLLEYYYDTESPIPTALPLLCRRLRLALPDVESVLNEFFVLEEDGWHNAYCDEEIKKYHRLIERQRINGSKGGRGNKANANPNKPTALPEKPTAKPTNNQEPITNNQEPSFITPPGEKEKKASSLSADWTLPKTWGDWAIGEFPELSPPAVRFLADEFRDYWHGISSKAAGKKTDWFATWRNWVRKADFKKIKTPPSNGQSKPQWLENSL